MYLMVLPLSKVQKKTNKKYGVRDGGPEDRPTRANPRNPMMLPSKPETNPRPTRDGCGRSYG